MRQKRLIHFVAFVALFCTAVSIMIMYFVGSDTYAGQVCEWIAFISMMLVVAAGGFMYARSKRNIIWMLLYLMAIAIIIAFRIIPLF
ncbi:MAG: hypothetical protein LBN07_03665 [Christensenellaceae bacterium]|jgi:hypothetical protein|nr:hypothetical protein [Christensenellaceae bacterium]